MWGMVSRLVITRSISRSALLISLVACGAAPPASRNRVADLVLRGGDVHTMDLGHPHATALAVQGETIVAVGSDADVAGWIGSGTHVVELAGHSVTPGLVDAHCHLYGLGVDQEIVSLRGLASEHEAASA